VRVVVADTGPLHYLVLVGAVDILPALFSGVTVPSEVRAELLHPAAPGPVRHWASNPPAWLTVAAVSAVEDPLLTKVDAGEAAAITLAVSLHAGLVLMDDRAGVTAARAKGLEVVGTVGVLDRAATRRLIDIAAVVARLKATNFRIRPALLDALVAGDRGGDIP
jgi:predicted nucleic acid-binding protein